MGKLKSLNSQSLKKLNILEVKIQPLDPHLLPSCAESDLGDRDDRFSINKRVFFALMYHREVNVDLHFTSTVQFCLSQEDEGRLKIWQHFCLLSPLQAE